MPHPRAEGNRDHEILYLFVDFVSVACHQAMSIRLRQLDVREHDEPKSPSFTGSGIDVFFRLLLLLACGPVYQLPGTPSL